MSNEHQIDGLMESAMNSIRDMVDVDTIIGQPINTADGSTIIPISRVAFGFAAGGSEFKLSDKKESDKLPFGGGSGAGVTINPVGFLVVANGGVKFISVGQPTTVDKIVDYIPDTIDKVKDMFKKNVTKYEGKDGDVYVSDDIES